MITRRKLLQLACAAGWTAATAHGESGRRPQRDEHTTDERQALFARAALQRFIGSYAENFRFELIRSEDGRQVYEVSASRGEVRVKGSSGVALARGAYVYLRDTCGAMFTWSGQIFRPPSHLPDYSNRRVVSPYRFVQYMNPCTFGYSTAFWDWQRWERELDWMALHGINMPLALEGQEALWQRVWYSFGVTQQEWNRFITGPAHLPWHRMGNINRFDGPLPQAWLEQKRALQAKILNRMLDLGMTPVVPAFAGHIPEAFLRIYPRVKVFTLLWGGADAAPGLPRDTRTFLLHPSEAELYREIGRRFIGEYKSEYKTGEYYMADTFNELTAPTEGPARYSELKAFARNIYASIEAGNPNGKWVMQGWLFANNPGYWDKKATEALLSGVPNDRMLIIDYASDMDSVHQNQYHDAPDAWKRLDSFFGKSWIDGMAHTFGGNDNVKGNLRLIASKPAGILQSAQRGDLVGWGLDMEGIESNEAVYELMTEVGWASQEIDLSTWIPAYCRARYGDYSQAMAQAWALLLNSAYGADTWKTRHAFQSRPSLEPKPQSVDTGSTFRQAVALFLSCAPQLKGSPLYVNDAIEFVAQAAGGRIDESLRNACAAHRAGEVEHRDKYAADAVSLMARVDALLHQRLDRRLETWVGQARLWGRTPEETASYDRSARLLITSWGWPELEDYASRMYSGLIRDYYAARWQQFFANLSGRSALSVEEWELQWLSKPYSPTEPLAITDVIAEARQLLES